MLIGTKIHIIFKYFEETMRSDSFINLLVLMQFRILILPLGNICKAS